MIYGLVLLSLGRTVRSGRALEVDLQGVRSVSSQSWQELMRSDVRLRLQILTVLPDTVQGNSKT